MNWALSRQMTMSMLGVPHPQRKEVERQHEDGVAGFVREAVDYVFRSLPVWTNYFWTLYLRGRYSADCCPEYLRPENFAALKGGLAERIEVHTCTVTAVPAGHARAHLPVRAARPHGLDEQLLSARRWPKSGMRSASAPHPMRA